MDGNGRWAKGRGLLRVMGHRNGVHAVRRTTEECCRLGIDYLTLYCLSIENWKRPQKELNQLMSLLEDFLIGERPTIAKNNVRLNFCGRREGLPASVLRELDLSLQLSEKNTGTTLTLAINYGGRTEIADACRRLAEQVKSGALAPAEIDESAIARELYTAGMPDPDLLIRTAGEQRISNFLLWQISYSEIWITDVYWPDFSLVQFHKALWDFANRERRYGGLTAG